MKHKNRNQQGGFSLVEVLLIVMIVGFIVILLVNLPPSVNLIGRSKSESLAKDIAVENIENQRSKQYDNLSNGTSNISDLRLSNLVSGSGTVEIKDCPVTICSSTEQIKEVVVTVNWSEKGETKSIVLTTLLSKGGLH